MLNLFLNLNSLFRIGGLDVTSVMAGLAILCWDADEVWVAQSKWHPDSMYIRKKGISSLCIIGDLAFCLIKLAAACELGSTCNMAAWCI